MIKARSFILSISFVLVLITPGLITESATVDQAQTIRRVVHIDPPEQLASRYFYVPFEVPPNVVRIAVSYEYDRARNTLDLGDL